MLKVELHTHTSDDPRDAIPYTATQLIDRAATLGYNALAITLHDRQLDISSLTSYARERGITLLPGVERTIYGKHILLVNFPSVAETVSTFEEVGRMRARWPGLVIAPHPFYPAPTCLRGLMDRHAGLFDAVEFNYFYTKHFDFNRPARRWAQAHGKPLVANADVHRLVQLGRTYSLVDAEPTPEAICEAIREGRLEIRTEPISLAEAAMHITSLATGLPLRRAERLPRPAWDEAPVSR
jgi:predicted metal-dependent phosphoesterase TrpH